MAVVIARSMDTNGTISLYFLCMEIRTQRESYIESKEEGKQMVAGRAKRRESITCMHALILCMVVSAACRVKVGLRRRWGAEDVEQ